MKSRVVTWLALGLILVGAAAIRLRLLDLPLDRDEGEYAYFGQLLLEGVPPYAAAYNLKAPGIYIAYALILAVFGHTTTGIHLGLIVVTSVATVLMFVLVRNLAGPSAGVVAAALYATQALNPKILGFAAYAEHFVLLFVIAGSIVLQPLARSRPPLLLVAGGLLFGLAFLMKQSAGAFLLFAVLYILLGMRDDTRLRLAAGAALVAGALAPFAALCLLMLLAGTFPNFWFWTFTYASEYATALPLAKGVKNLGSALRWILPTSYLAVAAACVGLSALFWDRPTAARRRFLVLLVGASLLATSAGLYFRAQYFILLLPALAVLTGVAVDAVARRLASVRARAFRYGIPIVLATVPLLHLVYLERTILFTDTPHEASRAIYGSNPFPESVEIGRYIREHTSPSERIAVAASRRA